MSNIQKVLGRHRWVEGFTETQLTGKRPVLKCGNCARIWDIGHRGDSPPLTGCISDLDLTRLGPSMQADQLERDLRGHLYQRTEH